MDEALSAALELAAADGDRLASKPPAYAAAAVRRAVEADRRADGSAQWARVRAGEGREWVRLARFIPEAPDSHRFLDLVDPEESRNERWDAILDHALALDPEGVTAWQMRCSGSSGGVIADALGTSKRHGTRLAERGWDVIRSIARDGIETF